MISKQKSFLKAIYPEIQKEAENKFSFEDFYFEVNKINNSLIRVNSNEVDYCLHIILRYKLEKALIEGSLKVNDLPKAWNELSLKYFGRKPKNDAEGCLQDVHFSNGVFGYFPTYVLGTIYSVQLFNQLKKEMPKLEKQISNLKFDKIKKWLEIKIHSKGRSLNAKEIITQVTKKEIDITGFVDYLTKKYSQIYELK